VLRRIIGEDVAIDVRRDPALWRVVADPNQIAQVLLNLAVNARDAMPTGGTLTIETENAIADEALARRYAGLPAGEYVRLDVRDTGVGMSEEVMAQAFEPFFTTKGLGKGTGLGLSTVYGIVRQSDGFIYAESTPGAGATFTIFLPRAPAAATLELAAATTPEAPRPGQTVLLVEDDAAVRAVARRILERSGYRVLAADSGREALRLVDEGACPDLVLTDSIMPQMSGREVVEQLRARWPRLPVVFMSGHSREAVVMHGVLAADSVFLEKPYTSDQLMRALERARQLVRANGD
jgi:CheY-like chemotaxis protein